MAVKSEKTAKATEPEKVTEKVQERKEVVDEASLFVYLGPTIQGVIQKASIFTGTREDVEKKLAPQIEKFPRIKALLISDKTIVEDRVNVNKPGTRLYVEYHKLVNELKK